MQKNLEFTEFNKKNSERNKLALSRQKPVSVQEARRQVELARGLKPFTEEERKNSRKSLKAALAYLKESEKEE